jgi:hypothetical protein
MRIFDLRNEAGEVHAFEIRNLFVSRRRACRIAASVPGAEMLHAKKSWSADDLFCVFRLGSRVIEITEPFGDSSRFLVGGNPPGWSDELSKVREVFAREPILTLPWARPGRHAG